ALTVTDLRTGSTDGKDTLTNVELLQVSNGQTALGAASASNATLSNAEEEHLDLMPLPSYLEQETGWHGLHGNWLGVLDKGLRLNQKENETRMVDWITIDQWMRC